MTVHYKVAGTWEQVDRPYLKVNGAHTPIKEVWVKDSGTWEQAFEYDVTPPGVPVISLEVVDTTYWEGRISNNGRHIKVGVRSPGGAHDSDLKRIRVLTTYNGKAPTTQYGGTYTSKPGSEYPDEPWSDFSFNGFNGSKTNKDSSEFHYKTWPRNAKNSTVLKGQQFYHFTAWAEDLNGNWSAANAAQIWVPRETVLAANRLLREARFAPTAAGSWVDGGFADGDLVQQKKGDSFGIWFYGNQITNNIGREGTATIRSAQIYVAREDDTGEPTANVYLYWHDFGSAGAVTGTIRNNTTKLGTLSKGQAKWFDLPEAFHSKLVARDIRGFGLSNKDPVKASAFADDYSAVKSLADNPRSGEFHVVWEETP